MENTEGAELGRLKGGKQVCRERLLLPAQVLLAAGSALGLFALFLLGKWEHIPPPQSDKHTKEVRPTPMMPHHWFISRHKADPEPCQSPGQLPAGQAPGCFGE